MRRVVMADIVSFAKKWLEAESHVVQHWAVWEVKASEFFWGRSGLESDSDAWHGVMTVVCCVCFGDAHEVKMGMRSATPRVLDMCVALLGHHQQFGVVLEAESRFRARELATDWMLYSQDGKMVVRSEFRRAEETEH